LSRYFKFLTFSIFWTFSRLWWR